MKACSIIAWWQDVVLMGNKDPFTPIYLLFNHVTTVLYTTPCYIALYHDITKTLHKHLGFKKDYR